MSLAAPAVAIANQSKTVGHTAPLLPTPLVLTNLSASISLGAGLAGVAPGIPDPATAAAVAAAAAVNAVSASAGPRLWDYRLRL